MTNKRACYETLHSQLVTHSATHDKYVIQVLYIHMYVNVSWCNVGALKKKYENLHNLWLMRVWTRNG